MSAGDDCPVDFDMPPGDAFGMEPFESALFGKPRDFGGSGGIGQGSFDRFAHARFVGRVTKPSRAAFLNEIGNPSDPAARTGTPAAMASRTTMGQLSS